jgi:Putative neutral zinc metallopeptidase
MLEDPAVLGVCARGRHTGRVVHLLTGIAAHEAGHALQDAEDYFPMEARTYIVPVVQLASQAAPWLFVTGLMLQLDTLTWVGVILFGSSFLLAFLTLPVEFNANARAKELLVSHGIIQGDEQMAGVEKVLGAAAWRGGRIDDGDASGTGAAVLRFLWMSMFLKITRFLDLSEVRRELRPFSVTLAVSRSIRRLSYCLALRSER